MSKNYMNKVYVFVTILMFSLTFPAAFGQTSDESKLFDVANEYFAEGRYSEAITIYDDILQEIPNNISTLKMKGIAQSNLGYHEKSLEQFFTILQYKPDDVLALTGMGVGFGNLGEYHEANIYFKKALEIKPDSVVIKNYKEFVDGVISKYPYTPTEKPGSIDSSFVIPEWIKPVAKWWSQGQIKDAEFVKALHFLITSSLGFGYSMYLFSSEIFFVISRKYFSNNKNSFSFSFCISSRDFGISITIIPFSIIYCRPNTKS